MNLEEIKQRLDIHEVAGRLGMERPGGRGNYRSPHRKDKTPSLALWTAEEARNGKALFKDWASGETGSVIDLVQYALDCDFSAAMAWLRDEFQLPREPRAQQPQERKSLPEWIADRCIQAARDPEGRQAVRAYLEGRGIPEAVVDRGLKLRALGWNTYTSAKVAPGEVGHGGPGVAFLVRHADTGQVVAVDTRYQDPALNGGLKTNSQGEKVGAPWCLSWRSLERARRVVLVESAINALSVEAAGLGGTTALALRGTQAGAGLPVNRLVGKEVVICMDADPINEHGQQPGPKAAWALYDQLTAAGVCAHLVDQDGWDGVELNDLNDLLQKQGPTAVREALKKLDRWLIPGL
ncbi:MAG: toprim domain-containing protein, partial [Ectothiorhodospira sp.]